MQIQRHRPVTRGVTELMYVGDAVENPGLSPKAKLLMVAGGVLAGMFAKNTVVKAIGWGVVTDVAIDYLLKKK